MLVVRQHGDGFVATVCRDPRTACIWHECPLAAAFLAIVFTVSGRRAYEKEITLTAH